MYKMVRNLIFFIFFYTFSFSQEKREKHIFDTIDYYRLVKSDDSVSKETRSLLDGTIYNNFENDSLVNLLEQNDFVNLKLTKEDFNFLKKKVFINSKCDFESAGNCIPVYRDFLVLKEKDEIVLVVYVCLHCHQVLFYDNKGYYFFKCFDENNKEILLENILRKYNLEK
jgi:hypothetical protein